MCLINTIDWFIIRITEYTTRVSDCIFTAGTTGERGAAGPGLRLQGTTTYNKHTPNILLKRQSLNSVPNIGTLPCPSHTRTLCPSNGYHKYNIKCNQFPVSPHPYSCSLFPSLPQSELQIYLITYIVLGFC